MEEKNNKSFQAGFTIFEVLAIVVIIGIMAGLGYSDFDNLRNQLALKRAAYQLGQDLRRAQEMALSDATATGGVPRGYGIYMDTTINSAGELSETDFYRLYADTSNPLTNQPDAGWGYYNPGSPGDWVYQSIIIKGGVVIKKFINYDSTALGYRKMSAEFVPPNPDTKIYDVTNLPVTTSISTGIQVVLGFPVGSGITQTKCVGINMAGLVTINDSCGQL